MMRQYVTVLLSSENADSREFNTFMNWKTFRKPFVPETTLIQPESDILSMLKPRMDRTREEEQEYYQTHLLYELKEPQGSAKTASLAMTNIVSERSTIKSAYSETPELSMQTFP